MKPTEDTKLFRHLIRADFLADILGWIDYLDEIQVNFVSLKYLDLVGLLTSPLMYYKIPQNLS